MELSAIFLGLFAFLAGVLNLYYPQLMAYIRMFPFGKREPLSETGTVLSRGVGLIFAIGGFGITVWGVLN